jgi:hypothetical protein
MLNSFNSVNSTYNISNLIFLSYLAQGLIQDLNFKVNIFKKSKFKFLIFNQNRIQRFNANIL